MQGGEPGTIVAIFPTVPDSVSAREGKQQSGTLVHQTFFRITDLPMTSLTLLGDTSMADVDFFAQRLSCVECKASTSVLVQQTGSIFVVPCLPSKQLH